MKNFQITNQIRKCRKKEKFQIQKLKNEIYEMKIFEKCQQNETKM